MQISDALQEFLCIPDQIKLVDYDNKRLSAIKTALFTDIEDPHPSDALEQSKLMRLRLGSMLDLMVKKQQGSIRFEFGRDWSLEEGKFESE